jgi:ribosome-binding factor A
MEEYNSRMRRVNELLHEAIAMILRRRFSKESVAITITKVACDPDLRHAKIYYSVLTDDKGPAVSFFRREAGSIARWLSEEVIFKRHPQLHFLYDESLKHMAAVDRLLTEISAPPLPKPKAKHTGLSERPIVRRKATKPKLKKPARGSSRRDISDEV